MRIYQQSFNSSTRFTTFSNVTLSTGSDARIKENVITIENALEKITKMRGVYFDWIPKVQNKSDPDSMSRQIGFIAQEVETVLPELILHDTVGIEGIPNVLSVDYPRITAVLVEGMKEQQTQINDLKVRLLTLEGRFIT
jgi:hypothetical protein